ncbi:MAG: hypothetical protein KAT65_05255 [Methanophagales archaeon]|nr:hypothetical protein [Methanophagales archaeon]
MSHKKVKIREDKASDVMKMDPYKFKLKHAQKAKKKYLYTVSIRSLILLTALAVIFVLLTAITVSATVTRPWVRVDVETSASCECAKIGDANNAGGNEIVAGGTSVIYMYVWDGDTWDRTTIDTLTGTVNDIVIANVDNTGGNKIAAALSTNTIYMYEWSGSGWDHSTVSTAVGDSGASVLDMSVGNADNEGGNKIVASTDDGDVAMFEWNTTSSAWDRTEIVDFGNNKVVYNVDVADCDNDGKNEVVIIHERKYMDPYYYSGGSWASEGEISHETSDTYLNIYVGNADNTGGDEVLSCTNSGYIYMYKWGGSSWSKSTVASTGSAINDIKADNVYNDGYNSVVSGGSAQDVIIYTYDSGSWPSSTVDDAAGGSVLEVTSGDADNDGKNEIVITAGSNIFLYEIITWESYKEVGHINVWGTVADPYSSTYPTVYMYGVGFTASPESYHVGYYDGNGDKQASETGSLAGTALSSLYDCTSHHAAQYGTWHAVVFKDDLGSPPATYADCSGTAGYIVEDDFEVQQSAIPEFPTVIAAIAVCLLCAVAYVVMRRNGGKR